MTGLFEPSSFALEKGQSYCSKSVDDQTGVGGTGKRLSMGKRSQAFTAGFFQTLIDLCLELRGARFVDPFVVSAIEV